MSFVFRTTAAALAALAVAATPAAARPYYGHGGYHRYHGGGIGLGGALLGAAIIGGIAVAASNNGRDRDYGYDDGPPPPPAVYGEAAPPIVEGEPGPVLDCTRAVEDTASQRGGRARVTGIDRVEPIDGGANVLGYVEIDNGGNYAITRTGFSCRAAYGRVTGVRLG